MSHTISKIIIGIGFFFLLSSCSKDVLSGSGSVVTREVPVTGVTSVALHYGIALDIRKATTSRLLISGYENLINEMPNKVENGHLDVTVRNGYERIRNNNLQVVLFTPDPVATIAQHGSGTLGVWGFESAPALEIRQHGSGDITLQQCSFSTVDIRHHSSGDILMGNVSADDIKVAVHGSGQTYVWSKEKLSVSINGSGNVYYKGTPQITSTIQGSGRLIKAD
jgi:hypothetical protein